MSSNYSRLLQEFQEISKAFTVVHFKNLRSYTVKFQGPKQTPYEGGVWHIQVVLKGSYPICPPVIRFNNKIFHPNVDWRMGIPCMDILTYNWNPNFTIRILFDYHLPQLLACPNADDAINLKAGQLFKDHPDEYIAKVADFIQKCATEENIKTMSETLFDDLLDELEELTLSASSSMSSINFCDEEPDKLRQETPLSSYDADISSTSTEDLRDSERTKAIENVEIESVENDK